ncbi:hypothetical protein ACPPUL_19475 [Ralstonia pseudosolanacearum]|uniref:hypothetical protein n=1 Tax=Ralstonia pseudosolanacearum TaxID=1310165 RepID=UPI0006BDF6F2|nr:hypothetical protein [Ralstonia pseudosolanacearum]AKZ27252.1 hypothetical protein ACH51_13485 [Ralstonia solanacearum]BCL93034.1 hypothetical protein MAFF211479_27350 [Ralstonia solanacearum]BCL96584.1 hypothetical protein MAFF211491_10360 [Ralstonia solanacearum]BCM11897.1 hypothetical protein MAFF241648_10870 [Ralstonia solanacearum]BCN05600.1 hypothetical protein RPSB_27370 [Ralstonia solanacearum]
MEATKSIPPDERGVALYRWRSCLGWDAAKVAGLLDVSARTVGLWETGVQTMPDARWRLWMYEVLAEVNRIPEMIVVLADDGLTPVDVVSDANYAGCAELAGDPYALIASYAIDRMTGKPRLHRQRFLTAANGHVINAAQRWDDERRVEAHNPDKAMLEMHRWLTRRVLEGELRNPRLTELKQAITDAKANLDKAGNVPEDVRTRLIRELDLAITALMEETTKTVDGRP